LPISDCQLSIQNIADFRLPIADFVDQVPHNTLSGI